MSRFLLYFLPLSIFLHWLGSALRKRGLMGTSIWLWRILPALLATAVMIVDELVHEGGITPSLMASDLLYMDAFSLASVYFLPRQRRLYVLPFAFTAAVLARSVTVLSGHAFPMDEAACMTLLSGALLTFSLCPDLFRTFTEDRLKGYQQQHAYAFVSKSVCSVWLVFLGLSTLVLGGYDGIFAEVSLDIVCVLLSLTYMSVQSPSSIRRILMKLIPAGSAQNFPFFSSPGKVKEESARLEHLFQRVEDYMQRERPFLDEEFTLIGLALEMATNKSLLSKAINVKSGKNFCQYVNKYRIDYAIELMKRDRRLRVGEISLMSGFHSLASFNMAFKLFMNDTPSEYMRTLHATDLQTATMQEGER